MTPVAGVPTGDSNQRDVQKDEYVIGPEDVVEVEVVGQPDHSRARVYTDGTIQVNLVGRIMASSNSAD